MLALALISVVLVVTAALGLLAGAQGARGQAQAGADLAALAGAGLLARANLVADLAGEPVAPGALGGELGAACRIAAETARRNSVLLTSCQQEPGGAVRVAASKGSVAGTATAEARAGPRAMP